MTVVTTDPNGWGDDVGLEDVEASDLAVPRLRINHADGTFKDPLANVEYPKLNVILLGLVKQRIFWRGEVEDGDKQDRPACKSPDFQLGFPNLDPKGDADKTFPVSESVFDISQYPPRPETNGHVALPCASCNFKDWTTTPGGKNVPPKCAEQHTYPLLYQTTDGAWVPAILTFQKTGIKPSRSYVSTFAQTKTPTFTVHTELSLDTFTRGTVKYSVPKFRKLDPTDQQDWPEYANRYRGLRDFIRALPRSDEDEESAPAATANGTDRGEDPWAKDNGTAPVTAVSPAPAPVPAPAPQAATVPAPAPTQATPAPVDTPAMAAPPEETTAAPAPASPPAADDDDLPF